MDDARRLSADEKSALLSKWESRAHQLLVDALGESARGVELSDVDAVRALARKLEDAGTDNVSKALGRYGALLTARARWPLNNEDNDFHHFYWRAGLARAVAAELGRVEPWPAKPAAEREEYARQLADIRKALER